MSNEITSDNLIARKLWFLLLAACLVASAGPAVFGAETEV